MKSTKARLIELDRPDGGVAREGRKAFEESKIERSPNSTEALDDWEFSANDAYETLQREWLAVCGGRFVWEMRSCVLGLIWRGRA